MSYDLMVFDASAVSKAKRTFREWYEEEMESKSSGHDPDVPTPRLRAWFRDMIKEYPPLNGPFSTGEVDDPKITDYSLGRHRIYTNFAWSEMARAYKLVKKLAAKHGVGFFDVSSRQGHVWVPAVKGRLKLVRPTEGLLKGFTLSVEDEPDAKNPTLKEVIGAIDDLTPDGGPGFLVLVGRNKNYAQSAGGEGAYVVEWREYLDKKKTNYTHCVAGHLGRPSKRRVRIPTNGFQVTVNANERLSCEDVKTILTAFAEGRERPAEYSWRDMSGEV